MFAMRSELLTVPNLLSLSRIPLTAVLCWAVAAEWWLVALLTFAVAAFTDWLDGWWARRFNQLSAVGRALDPLTDKVLIASAFIFLIPVPDAGIHPWVVAVVVVREVLITGLRGMVEAAGKSFGADWFGKLKTVLQCAVLIGVLLLKTLRANEWWTAALPLLDGVQAALLWAMLIATVGSAVQYGVRAAKLLTPQ
jgi:CDP-diacylglycerol---glycerol-3-phosphate 3-phosphatidyltransferase